ncbi:hypothetical protein EUTSA_v10017762mg [Eutrema salsugineum]|uniref:BTB domain-containing protein n=1 Tax=Eutrema salsugineum TaxID=72664 RepID=V4LQ90_EUTSA|nr:hypothetical protein EUTSA_v10017762mg [Eutrema salsugineum]
MNSKAKFTRTGIETVNHMEFFRGIIKAFKEQRHVDVWLKAGDQTDAIPAHKLILAAKSKVFRNILETDDCKASPKETITLSEMTKDKKLVQHVHSLYQAADKYEIPYLQDICRKQLIDSMNTSNAFDLLELAKIHSDEIFEDSLSEFITRHMEEISFSSKFMSFVESNPALAVQTIRRHFDKLRNDVPK